MQAHAAASSFVRSFDNASMLNLQLEHHPDTSLSSTAQRQNAQQIYFSLEAGLKFLMSRPLLYGTRLGIHKLQVKPP
jgi:hypothetical protein